MAVLPNLKYFQWSRPSNPIPRLASPISASATTINVTAPPLDNSGTVITGNFIMGIENVTGYVENVYIPAGGVSVDGKTLSNVVRGIDLEGTDYTTSNASLATAFDADAKVFCSIAATSHALLINAIQGGIATNSNILRIGDETDSDIRIFAQNNAVNKPFFEYNEASDAWIYSNDGVSSTPFGTGAGVTAGNGIDINAGVISIDVSEVSQSILPTLPEELLPSQEYGESITDKNVIAVVNSEIVQADGNDATRLGGFIGIADATASSGENKFYSVGNIVDGITLPSAQMTFATSPGDTTYGVQSANTWLAQIFNSAFNTNLTEVILGEITKTGSPTGTFDVDLYSVSGSDPDTLIQSLGTFNAADYSGTLTIDLSSSPIALTEATDYAIVINSGSLVVDVSNYVKVGYDSGIDIYKDGEMRVSTNGGVSWSGQNYDLFFTLKTTPTNSEFFLGDTAGVLQSTPGTYLQKVGRQLDSTSLLLFNDRPAISVAYNFSLGSAAETVDTEFLLGFRPKMIFCSVSVSSSSQPTLSLGRPLIGFWMNTGTQFGIGYRSDPAYADNYLAGDSINALAHWVIDDGTDINTAYLKVQSTSYNTVTIRRNNALTAGSPSNTTYYVKLHIYG